MYHRYHHYIHINVIIGFCPFFFWQKSSSFELGHMDFGFCGR